MIRGVDNTPAGLRGKVHLIVDDARPEGSKEQTVWQPQDGGGEDVRPCRIEVIICSNKMAWGTMVTSATA